MPSSRSGSPASATACASRSASVPPRCAISSKPAGSHAPGAPSSTTMRRAAGVHAAACSVSASAASATAAASAGDSGGQSRVFA